MIDRRSGARVPLEGQAIVLIGGQRLVCQARDISISGLLVGLPPHPIAGTHHLRVFFTLPSDGNWLDAQATLAREMEIGPRRFWGMKFVNPALDVRAQIGDYVEERARRERAAMARPRPRVGSRSSPSIRVGSRSSPSIRVGSRSSPSIRVGSRSSPSIRVGSRGGSRSPGGRTAPSAIDAQLRALYRAALATVDPE